MKQLVVLYDSRCGFCIRCRGWLTSQPKFVAIEFYAAGGPDAVRHYPELASPGPVDELIVVDDEGGVYRGSRAWLMCLWALVEYREWADWLASPALLPLARGAFALISSNRGRLSKWLGLAPEGELIKEIRMSEPPRCVDAPGTDPPRE